MIILIWLLLASPSIPLGFMWAHGLNSGITRLAGAVLTGSYVWLMLALMSSLENRLLGPAYSDLRIAIPYANVAVVTTVMIILSLRGELRASAVLASTSIILCWLYVSVISFVV